MDINYIQLEINKHKNDINNLSNNLINTIDVILEIKISEEIKKQTDFLITLFNIKKNALINNQMFMNNNNNNMNTFNPMIKQNTNINFNLLEQQQITKGKEINNFIKVVFDDRSQKTIVNCQLNEKISDIIDKFRKKVNLSDNGETFIFNAQPLNPNLTVAKVGLAEWSMIYVIRNNGIRGG